MTWSEADIVNPVSTPPRFAGHIAMAGHRDEVYLVGRQQGDSAFTQLRRFANGAGGMTAWFDDGRFAGDDPHAQAGLAVHDGWVHCVLAGSAGMEHWRLRRGSFEKLGEIPGHKSHAPPSLASDGAVLHMVHLGFLNKRLFYTTFENGAWSAGQWLHRLQSHVPPVVSCNQGNVQIFTTDASGRVRMIEKHRTAGGFQQMDMAHGMGRGTTALAACHFDQSDGLGLISMRPRPGPTTHLPPPNLLTCAVFRRGPRAGRGIWTGARRLERFVPALPGRIAAARTRRHLHLVWLDHLGRAHAAWNGATRMGDVRIGFKIARPVLATWLAGDTLERRARRLTAGANGLLGRYGVNVRQAAPPQVIDLQPDLLDLDTGGCVFRSRSEELDRLNSHRAGLSPRDVACYIVPRIGNGVVGCAFLRYDGLAMIPDTDGVNQPDTETVVLAHEIGHVLGLEHVDPARAPFNIMAGAGPLGQRLTPQQATQMMTDPNVLI
ncbi:hypothetical protein [Vannielia litorea]|uniref:Peptidase M10 metallopeptidase domain-containing protein n=1 Tax=Vannielia litorea TaxID=1217970 RepID=A0A1N6FCP7_9RHOB|nr:hypothetical protein [Vannielia litorea]SIN93004.1 hypothetical protein SAMN05444002_1565 [Vannielia litorea]